MSLAKAFQPDSVFATQRLAKGEIQALPLMSWNILKRALFLSAGIALAGVKGRQLVLSSLYSSTVLSGILVGYFMANPDYTTDVCADKEAI
tara:strand:- start:12806 stop:13078 length:273 start_codon:yes stop_codon:yes gene_type:complete